MTAPPTKATAIVLRLIDYGDADRVVTFLTRERGKLSAFARGARKSQRRFGAGLALFAVGEAMLGERHGADLLRLEGFTALETFGALLGDLERIASASYLVELCREFLREHHAEPAVFDLILEGLGALVAQGAERWRVTSFELKLLEAVGLAPPLSQCQVCGRVPMPARLDLTAGGVVCDRCGRGRLLPDEVRLALLELAEAPLAGPSPVESALARRAGEASRTLVVHHLGRPLRSAEFLERL